MTEQLRNLLREEGERLDVPPPPTGAILAGGRRARRRRSAFVAAACLAVLAGGVVGLSRLAVDGDRGRAPEVAGAPTPDTGTPTPDTGTPTPDAVVAGSLELSGSGVGGQRFGTDAEEVMADVTARFGDPDVTVGPERYARIPGNGDTWFADAGDNISPSWQYPVASVSCWRTLCLVFGGSEPGTLRLRGWELSQVNRWSGFEEVQGERLDVRLAGSGIRLGDTWKRLHAAYPGTVVDGAEGAAVAVKHTPWPGISDGLSAWRLSGVWDYQHPRKAPEGAVVTRLSAGEGPEPGCC